MVKRINSKMILLIAAVVMLLILFARPVHAEFCPHCGNEELEESDVTYSYKSEDTCETVINYECENCSYMETKKVNGSHVFQVLEKTVKPLNLHEHKVITTELCTNCGWETQRTINEDHNAVLVKVGGKSVYKCKVCGQVIPNTKNPLSIKGKTVTVKYSKLKMKKQVIKAKKAITVSKAKGKVTYKLASVKKARFKKYFTVSSTGKITVKKGLKKGTYKLKLKVTAAGNANYKPLTKSVTLNVKVK